MYLKQCKNAREKCQNSREIFWVNKSVISNSNPESQANDRISQFCQLLTNCFVKGKARKVSTIQKFLVGLDGKIGGSSIGRDGIAWLQIGGLYLFLFLRDPILTARSLAGSNLVKDGPMSLFLVFRNLSSGN